MKTIRLIIGLTIFFITVNIDKSFAQKISKEDRKEIRNKEREISAKEEMLLSGIKGLKKIESRLIDVKNDKKATKEEVARKERIVNSVKKRLSDLAKEITEKKKALNKFRVEAKKVSKKTKLNVSEKREKMSFSGDLAEREKRLKEAREKLASDRKEREEKFRKEQEAYRKEQEKLARLDKQIKAEKEKIVKAKEAAKEEAQKEKNRKINAIEDEISVDVEMLNSGKEGLEKLKSNLKAGEVDGTLSQEDIERKKAVISNIEKRLAKIEEDIKKKKLQVLRIKNLD